MGILIFGIIWNFSEFLKLTHIPRPNRDAILNTASHRRRKSIDSDPGGGAPLQRGLTDADARLRQSEPFLSIRICNSGSEV